MPLTLEQLQEKARTAKALTTASTPNKNCPACVESRRHTLKEFGVYHPEAGKGSRVERRVES